MAGGISAFNRVQNSLDSDTPGPRSDNGSPRGTAVPAQQPFKSGKTKGHVGAGTHAGMKVIHAGEHHAGVTNKIKKF